MAWAVAWAVWLRRLCVSLFLLLKLRDTTLRGLGRGLGGPVGLIWGVPVLLRKCKDTNLRGLDRGLGGLVGSILGVPLLLLKLRDTNLRGLGRGLGGPVGSMLVSLFCFLN